MSFAAIYRRYHQDLYRYCLAILGNREDAQDALQNTMVKAMRALPGEKRRIELKPWLYRVAHNESIELLRRRRPGEEIDAELAAPGSDAAETAAQRERLRQLLSDLEKLPERQRGALLMRELAGLGFEQVAAALETSPAAARQAVYEARLGLRRMAKEREMDRQAFDEEIAARKRDLAALAPLPPAASAALLHGVLGGKASAAGAAGASGGSAVGTGAVGTAGKALAGSAIVKSAATVAVVAAVGVAGADRAGLVHVLPTNGRGGAKAGAAASTPAGVPSGPGSPRSSTPRAEGMAQSGGASAENRRAGSQGSHAKGSSHVAKPTKSTPRAHETAKSHSVQPDKGHPHPFHGNNPSKPPQATSTGREHEATHPNGNGAGGAGSGGSPRNGGGESAQHGPPGKSGNGAPSGSGEPPESAEPPAGTELHPGGTADPGTEGPPAGEGEGLRRLLPGEKQEAPAG